MEFFRIRRDIPFMKHAVFLNAFSTLAFVLAVFFLVVRGLNLSVEFTGGTVIEVAYPQAADVGAVRQTLSGLGYTEATVQNFGSASEVMMRLPVVQGQTSAQQSDTVLAAFQDAATKAKEYNEAEMQKVTGSFQLPGMF